MPQVRLFDVIDVHAVIADLAVGDIIEAVNEVCDGRLARAGRTDEGQLLTGLCVEGNVMQHRLAGNIGKIHVEEAHVAAQRHKLCAPVLARAFPCPASGALRALGQDAVFLTAVDQRIRSLVRLRLLLQQLKDASRAGNGHGNGVELLRYLRHIRRELLAHAEIGRNDRNRQRRDQRAGRDEILDRQIGNALSGRDQQAARKRRQDVEQIADVVHDRPEDICKAVRTLGIPEKLLVQHVKIALRSLLVAEHLDDLLTVHHFLDEALGLTKGLLLPDEEGGRFSADALGRPRHGHYAEQHDRHQRYAEIDHHGEHADHGQAGGKQVRQALRNDLTERIRVVRIAAHDIAAVVLVEIGNGQPLHRAEHPHARIVQEALRHMRHQLRVDRREDQACEIQHDHDQDRAQDLPGNGVPAAEKPLLDAAGHSLDVDGRRNADGRAQDDADRNDRHMHRIILEHHLHQASEHLKIHFSAACSDGSSPAWAAYRTVSHFPHLPFCSGIRRLHGRFDCCAAAPHAVPCRRSCRFPLRRPDRRPERRICAAQ